MRLLIVEDNAELSRLVASGLSAAGYESEHRHLARICSHGVIANQRVRAKRGPMTGSAKLI
ncbi:response regulator transcription factor [Bradyrhizobium sp. cf659]|uniref:response regulator transcription factor n=1 Tax=Bradyrhizobium sp. cf659 TaxID=1761771 RepID=UPI000B8939F2|nr:response regulator transcription factor [Bradyrhizobium sp. cf659]